MPADSIDAIVTDPPYGLAFMGKRWDYDVPSVEIWAECLRVLKPGGHLLAFAGTRTQHRMTVRIEDAGFEIRDMIAWVYGSGFPKSHDAAQSVEKLLTTGTARRPDRDLGGLPRDRWSGSVEGGLIADTGGKIGLTTDAARQWQGWGTALKPALEPITVARKPLIGTVAENVLAHGTGALNIDRCRVEGAPPSVPQPVFNSPTGRTYGMKTGEGRNGEVSAASGRWPANLIHDGSEEVLAGFPAARSAGNYPSDSAARDGITTFGGKQGQLYADSGSAARFFYCAKASKRDRDEGLEHMQAVHRVNGNKWTDQDYRVTNGERPASAESGPRKNIHPTVKPTDLMRYLCRLVTPPGGVVLDPFMGSGSTGKAAVLEDFRFIGIEREKQYLAIAKARIAHSQATPKQEALL